jgi:hypothetical protein
MIRDGLRGGAVVFAGALLVSALASGASPAEEPAKAGSPASPKSSPSTLDRLIELGATDPALIEATAASGAGTIEGYTDRTGYVQGDTVTLHVSCATPTWDLQVIRVQDPWWAYEGVVLEVNDIPGVDQPMPTFRPWEGAGWAPTTSFTVDPAWPSGQYIARMTAEDGDQHVHPFVVREDEPGSTSRIALVTMYNTVNAYNTWGGGSIYIGPKTRVGFRRPYRLFGGWSSGIYNVRLHTILEEMGYELEYLTEDDIERDPCILRPYDVVILAGHHEYTTSSFYDAMEMHQERGGHIVCCSANDLYWQARKVDDGSLMDCYKYQQSLDRVGLISSCRATYRYDLPPLNRPSERLKGLQLVDDFQFFEHGDYRVVDPGHWVWEGIDIAEGEILGDTMAHGEQDTITDLSPMVDILLHGRRDVPRPGSEPPPGVTHVDTYAIFFSRSPEYGFPEGNGGMVFSAGTLWGFIDNLRGPDKVRVQAMFRNILDRMLDTPPPPSPPCAWVPWCDTVVVPHETATIAGAIEQVGPGGVVIVGPGTYDEVIDPQGKPVRVIGLESTGSQRLGQAGDLGPRIRLANGEGPETEIANFRIDGHVGSVAGGAVRVEGASPTLRGLQLTGNSALLGGAIHVADGAPLIVDAVISGNTATVGPAINVVGDGPGPRLEGVLICDNGATPIAGPWVDGGGNTILNGCSCPADTNEDGVVDFTDLVTCLSQWGPCGHGTCTADFNRNGSVDMNDLLIVLSSFGPC